VELFRRGSLMTVVQRRYSDFERLRRQLQAQAGPAISLLHFPPKTTLPAMITQRGRARRRRERLVQRRESLLQQWLNAAICLQRRPGQAEANILPWFGY
jgi:hypothetical protein